MVTKPLTPETQDEQEAAATVAEVIDTSVSPQFVLDQMSDKLERAAIEARGRTDDRSIRWHHGVDAEDGSHAFSVTRDDAEPQHGLTVDEAKAALDAFVADA